MIGLGPIIELVKVVIWSGQVEGERPLSMILVAPAGSGKTTALEKMHSETSEFLSDLTSRDIMATLKKSPLFTHLLLGDFLSVFGHNKSTVKLSINLLGRLTGESVKQMPFSGEKLDKERRMGFITAIPPEDLNKREIKNHVRSGGFASRFLMAKYEYTEATKRKVHEYIRKGLYSKESPIDLAIKPGAYQIKVNTQLSMEIQMQSKELRNDPVGFRAHLHLRCLAKSIARSRGSNEVTQKDFDRLVEFCQFFTERGKTI